jgi:DNA-binding HxlR family transcriptional regulator
MSDARIECSLERRGVCGVVMETALHIVEGRWKLTILSHLFAGPALRYSELERRIPAVSQRMLARQLRDLERDGVISRAVFPEVPPRVEYRLTDRGRALAPVFSALLDWAEADLDPDGTTTLESVGR